MKNNSSIFPIILLFLTSFLLGVFSTVYVAKTDNNILSETRWKASFSESNIENLDLSSLTDTYNILKENYYNVDDIEKESLIEGMKKGLVDAIGDRHSEFMTPDEKQKFEEVLSGDFEWIWAVVETHVIGIEIERILNGSPAKQYWVRAWDIVLEANEHKLEWLSLYDAVEKIKGPAGTSVNLKILRTWETKPLDILVVRDKIKIPSVEEEYFADENINYIALNLFWEETSREFKKALENIPATSQWLIIDLRDNGGWFLQSSVEILSEF